jgi:UDP-glucuronate 4-epimerase
MDDPAGTIAANVSSAAAVLNACSTRSPQTVRSFVLASSGSVYGDNNTSVDAATGAPIASRETDATDDPTSPYAASKRAAELVCRALIASKREVRSISHWSPYDRVGVVNADP